MVSYALGMSMYIASVGCFFDFWRRIWSVIAVRVRVVSDCGLKAYWYGDKMLCWRRCIMSWLFMIVSNILAMMGMMEMGR
jgi:hypothetical protein